MSGHLYTAAELAERLRLDEDELHVLRRRHHWPCVKLGRFHVRFTEAQYDQIVAQMTVEPTKTEAVEKVPGQTARSAARQRSA